MPSLTGPVCDAAVEVQSLFTQIARVLVDQPECVRIEAETVGNETVLRVFAAPKDVGKLIGTQGRMARSLRVLLGAMSMRYRHSFSLSIEDRPGDIDG